MRSTASLIWSRTNAQADRRSLSCSGGIRASVLPIRPHISASMSLTSCSLSLSLIGPTSKSLSLIGPTPNARVRWGARLHCIHGLACFVRICDPIIIFLKFLKRPGRPRSIHERESVRVRASLAVARSASSFERDRCPDEPAGFSRLRRLRCRCSPRKYYSGRACSLADPRSVVHLALKCSDIFEHVGLQTLLDDLALLQIAQDATDILARHPGHGSQVLPADPLVEQNASATRVLADIVREFEQRAGNTAPHRQEARGGQGLVGLSQACRQDGREILVGLRIVFGALLKRLPGDIPECRVAQGDGRCRPRLVIDERELADDLALSHQRDDAFFAPIRRNRDFDQALLDAIAAIAAVSASPALAARLNAQANNCVVICGGRLERITLDRGKTVFTLQPPAVPASGTAGLCRP